MNQIDDVMYKFRVGSKQYGDFVIIRNDEDIPSERVVLNLVSAALTIAFEAGKNSDKPPIIKRLKTSLKRMGDSDSIPESLRNKDVIGFRTRVLCDRSDDDRLWLHERGDYVVLDTGDVAPSPATITRLLEQAFQCALLLHDDRCAIGVSDLEIIIKPIPAELKSDPDDIATVGFKYNVVSERSLVMDRLFGSNEGAALASAEEGGSSDKA